jgi:hypothetical protein
VYHATAGVNARADVFLDDDVRRRFLALFAETTGRYAAIRLTCSLSAP